MLAYATGGAPSPLSTLFGLSTRTAALVLGGSATLWTAVCSLGLYGLLALAMASGLVDPPADQRAIVSNPIEATYQMVVTVTAIVLVTAIGGTLADRLVLTGDALVRSEVSRASLARLYEDVVRSIPVAIVTFDAAGRVDGANPMASQLLGREGAQLLGEDVRAVLPFIPDALGSVEGVVGAGDATLETPSGAIPVSFHSAPLTDHTAAVRGGMVVVDDRSREERLRVAVEQAERFAVLGRLAAGLAHEIRNPLGAISGCVELVRETADLSPEERNLLVTAGRDVGRLNQLVTDMLQFARPRPPEMQPTDLAGLAREVVTMARTSDGPESNVALTVTGDAAVVTMADGNQVRQVLWNLVRNAAQASRRGGEVEVSVRGAAQCLVGGLAGAGLHLRSADVLDRGPGVAPELRDRLFDAFYSGTARGTGLGLAMVKRIADAHGGRVEGREREGGGSVFAVVIPRDAAEIVDEVAVRRSERPAT
jgi:two-component system sensor histidine kinase PilS (NtrC family)